MEEFLRYIVTPAGLGAAATLFMQLIQKQLPNIAGDVAFLVSVLVAAVVGLGGYYIIPFLQTLPPDVELVIWPVLTWAFNYIWHRFFTEHPE